ncbi:MAG: hypothetical protein CUN55_12570 [Phototrophicales bacterium]|nr:MAG: hypothetical protein CUN55_12570 [Phototrophicales bacterium]
MKLDYIRTLYDYNYWAHKRVWTCVIQLSEEQFQRPLDYSIGSIHAQIVHTMSAEHVWFSRLRGESPQKMFQPEDYPTFDSIRQTWDKIESQVYDYLNQLDEATLASELIYQNTKGQNFSTSIWGILLHVVNHGTDHRAQTLAMIDRVGGPTIDQDLIRYLREH